MKNLKQIEIFRVRLALCNRWAIPVLAAVGIAVGADLTFALAAVGRPVAPVPPGSFGSGPPADLSGFNLPAAAFQTPASSSAASVSVGTAKESVWKLKGIISGADKRAFLEDTKSNQTVWVREGEMLGDSKVCSIRERSIELEKGGTRYEVRM